MPTNATPGASDDGTTTIKLTPELVMHLREVLFEDLHERAERLAEAAHAAHEGPSRVAGDDAHGAWAQCGMHESAAILDLIGWSTRDEAERLRARKAERLRACNDEEAA